MLGEINPLERKVTIIGGGFSGLLSAYVLSREGYDVRLFEASDRLGGLIRTHRLSSGVAEGAAHSMLVAPDTEALLSELNVPMVESRTRAKYVLRDGRMRKIPLSFGEILSTVFRAFAVKGDPESVTLGQWGRRHLGSAANQYLITPMVSGIFAASPDELCVEAAFPKLVVPSRYSLIQSFLKRNKKHKEKHKMMAPRHGMEDVVRGLEKALRKNPRVEIFCGVPLTELPAESSGGNIILTTPASVTAQLLEKTDLELAQKLREIRYSPLTCVTVFVRKDQLRTVPEGVGVLAGGGEKLPALGILFNSSAFEYRVTSPDLVSFSVFMGGTKDPELVRAEDDEILRRIQIVFQHLFGMSGTPVEMFISRHPQAIPLYDEKLLEMWKAASVGWCAKAGRMLFGNYTRDVSLRGMMESFCRAKLESK